MKKKILIGILILVLIITLVILFVPKNSKFYLDEEYYNTEEEFITIESDKLKELVDNKSSFVVFTYLPYCTFSVPCDVIFKTFLTNNKMSFYSIPYDELDSVKEFKKIKYAPSVIIVKEGKIVKYLDANSDEDLSKYQDVKEFTSWIKKYIKIK